MSFIACILGLTVNFSEYASSKHVTKCLCVNSVISMYCLQNI